MVLFLLIYGYGFFYSLKFEVGFFLSEIDS